MKKNDLDKRIFELAQQEEIDTPKDFDKRIEATLKNVMQKAPKKRFLGIRKPLFFRLSYQAVAAMVCIFVLSSVTVYAAIDKYYERMQGLTDEQIESIAEDMQNSPSNADSYSRELTESERERMDALIVQYESGERYPQHNLLVVDSEDEIPDGVVAFLPSTSTFYLPKEKLSDEQLLQMIDYRYKRDYSLEETLDSEALEIDELELPQVRITEEQARQMACDIVEGVHGVDTSVLDISVELDAYRGYLVYMNNRMTLELYAVQIASDTGVIWCIEYGQGEFTLNNIPLEEERYYTVYERVEETFENYIGDMTDIEETYACYSVTAEGLLYRERVTYVFETTGEMCYIFVYSPQKDALIEISLISKEAYEGLRQSSDELRVQSGMSLRRIDFVIKD